MSMSFHHLSLHALHDSTEESHGMERVVLYGFLAFLLHHEANGVLLNYKAVDTKRVLQL